MIQKFVDRFMARKNELESMFAQKHPASYDDIVGAVVSILHDDTDYYVPDPKRIHLIDDGDYQGTLVYIVACNGYQPRTYWYVRINYGSCSGCDTLQAIHGYSGGVPTDAQVKAYMTLALHVVQQLKEMDGDTV